MKSVALAPVSAEKATELTIGRRWRGQSNCDVMFAQPGQREIQLISRRG